LKFILRKPVFPILIDTGTELVVLRTAAEGERRLAGRVDPDAGFLAVIDARVEGFAYHPGRDTLSPLALKKVWTKAEIVALYNARKSPDAPAYAPTLATRKLAQVFADVVKLLRPPRGGSAPRSG
jgi:hypothetical protein